MKGGKNPKEKGKSLDDQQKKLKKIGARIRELRKLRGYSSHETFAYEHDINRATMGRLERGADMKLSTLIIVMKALDVEFDEFFQWL